jgi:hypothetical protein
MAKQGSKKKAGSKKAKATKSIARKKPVAWSADPDKVKELFPVQALLGCLLKTNQQLDRLIEKLEPLEFVREDLWALKAELHAQGAAMAASIMEVLSGAVKVTTEAKPKRQGRKKKEDVPQLPDPQMREEAAAQEIAEEEGKIAADLVKDAIIEKGPVAEPTKIRSFAGLKKFMKKKPNEEAIAAQG